MGHQVNFYALPDDAREIEAWICSAFGAILVDCWSRDPPPTRITTAVRQYTLEEGCIPEVEGIWYGEALVVLPAYEHRLPFVFSEVSKLWVTVPFGRPAVELHIGRWNGSVLRRSRLWYEKFDPVFDKWAASILRALKQRLVRMDGTRN